MGERQVICPTCGYKRSLGQRCYVCGQVVELAANDFQDVVFVSMDEGYHSWYSAPTSVHERYRCKSYGLACDQCVHNKRSDIFCFEGRVDIRRRRRQRMDGSVYYEYGGWIEEG